MLANKRANNERLVRWRNEAHYEVEWRWRLKNWFFFVYFEAVPLINILSFAIVSDSSRWSLIMSHRRWRLLAYPPKFIACKILPGESSRCRVSILTFAKAVKTAQNWSLMSRELRVCALTNRKSNDGTRPWRFQKKTNSSPREESPMRFCWRTSCEAHQQGRIRLHNYCRDIKEHKLTRFRIIEHHKMSPGITSIGKPVFVFGFWFASPKTTFPQPLLCNWTRRLLESCLAVKSS